MSNPRDPSRFFARPIDREDLDVYSFGTADERDRVVAQNPLMRPVCGNEVDDILKDERLYFWETRQAKRV